MTSDYKAYIRNETAISMVINGVISAGFTYGTFGGLDNLEPWGAPSFALDFLPQSFAVAFFSVLVPSLLTPRRVRCGAIAAKKTAFRLPQNLVLRALIVAITATAVLGGTAIGATAVFVGTSLSFPNALLLKVMYGAVEAAIVTIVALHAAFADGTPVSS